MDDTLLINPTDSVTPRAESLPVDAFPFRDEEDTHTDCSTAVLPNVTELVAYLLDNIFPMTVM